MAEIDLSRARPLGKGQWAEKGIADPALATRLGAYKGRIAGSYRALLPEDVSVVPAGSWVSPKIDGELWFLVLDGKDAWLANPRGAVITGDIPLLKEAISAATKLKIRLIMAGELHTKVEGRRCRVGDLASALGGAEKADVSKLCFAAFDVLTETSQAPAPYGDRLETIRKAIPSGNHLLVAETFETESLTDIRNLYEEYVISGKAEGLVIRAHDGMIYKVKPSHTIDAVILGYTVKADTPESVRSILLGLIREDGNAQVWGACGNLGSEEDRKSLLARLAPIKTGSRYRYASDSGGLYSFVKPEFIGEVKVTDLQAEKSDGTAVMLMALNFDGNTWNPIRPMASASPLHPVLIRLRDDKKADGVDARFAQIEDWISRKPDSVQQGDLPRSQLLRREVWKKDTKGKVAVRKLLVWKSNKEITNPAFPAYVVHWTDYSAGRGTPLDREVRLAPDESLAMQIADKMIADNIKKGWEKAS